LLGATYNFDVAKLHFAYGLNKGANSSPRPTTDSNDALVGVTVPFGPHTLLASAVRKNDKTAQNRDANQWGVGYRYALSKRTDLYTAYARIKNKNGVNYTVGSAIEPGSGDKAFNVGVRHTF
jgi:predicted porin